MQRFLKREEDEFVPGARSFVRTDFDHSSDLGRLEASTSISESAGTAYAVDIDCVGSGSWKRLSRY